MNEPSTSSSHMEIIETIVFEPIKNEWNQTALDQRPPTVRNHLVRLVTFEGPDDLSDKLQAVMVSSFNSDNQDNNISTGTEISLSKHHQSVSSLSWIPVLGVTDQHDDLYNYASTDKNYDPLRDGSMEEDEVDCSGFDKTYFTSSPSSYQIQVIPEPPIHAFREDEKVRAKQEQDKTKSLRRKGIKLDDVLRTRSWGKCVRLSSRQRKPTYLRRQASE